MDVFSRTPQQKTQETVDALKQMITTIENEPRLLLEVCLQGAFAWRQKVRRTSMALFSAIDDSVLDLIFTRFELQLQRHLNMRSAALAALHGKALTKEKAHDLAIQELGSELDSADTARKEEDAAFDAATEPRPGLTLEDFADKLPAYPDNAGMATDQSKL